MQVVRTRIIGVLSIVVVTIGIITYGAERVISRAIISRTTVVHDVGGKVEDVDIEGVVSEGVKVVTEKYNSAGKKYTMYLWKIDPEAVVFDLAHSVPGKDVKTWLEETKDVLLVVNGFYFSEDFMPSGVAVDGGKQLGHVPFDSDKSAFIQLVPQFDIVDTTGRKLESVLVEEGGQTYPFLIKDGVQSVVVDSGKNARRSFIGQDREGNVYIGIVPHQEISLYELAKWIASLQVQWEHVVNLDGGPSTGLSYRADNGKISSLNSIGPVPNVIRLFKKKP